MDAVRNSVTFALKETLNLLPKSNTIREITKALAPAAISTTCIYLFHMSFRQTETPAEMELRDKQLRVIRNYQKIVNKAGRVDYRIFWILVDKIIKVQAALPNEVSDRLEKAWNQLPQQHQEKALHILNKQKVAYPDFMSPKS